MMDTQVDRELLEKIADLIGKPVGAFNIRKDCGCDGRVDSAMRMAGQCPVQKKRPLGRAPVQWPSARNGGRRIGACSDLDWPSGTLCSSAIPVAAVPWRMAPTSSGWLSHGAASLFATAHAPAKNPAARSAAERAEREADQMRPCTPLTFTPAPRESAIKPVPHPAAPVGEPSQTRRHHLTPTPVQQLCTHVQSCGQSAFFSYTGRGAFSFWR